MNKHTFETWSRTRRDASPQRAVSFITEDMDNSPYDHVYEYDGDVCIARMKGGKYWTIAFRDDIVAESLELAEKWLWDNFVTQELPEIVRNTANDPDVLDAAIEAFWNEIALRHPEIKTGDLSPSFVLAFESVCKEAYETWLSWNS